MKTDDDDDKFPLEAIYSCEAVDLSEPVVNSRVCGCLLDSTLLHCSVVLMVNLLYTLQDSFD